MYQIPITVGQQRPHPVTIECARSQGGLALHRTFHGDPPRYGDTWRISVAHLGYIGYIGVDIESYAVANAVFDRLAAIGDWSTLTLDGWMHGSIRQQVSRIIDEETAR